MKDKIKQWFITIMLLASIYFGNDQLLVLNSLGETISSVDLEIGEIIQNIAVTGVSPNAIYFDENVEKIYVINSISSSLQVFNTAEMSLIETFDLGDGNNPWAMAIKENYGFITNFQTSTLSKINLETGEIISTVDVPGTPEDVLLYNENLYIACPDFDFNYWTYGQGKIRILSVETLEQIAEYDVHTNPQALLLDSLNLLHVLCTGNYWDEFGVIDVIDLSSSSIVANIDIGGSPGNFAINENGIVMIGAGGWGEFGYAFSYDAYSFMVLFDEINPLEIGLGAGNVTVFGDIFIISCFSSDEIWEITQIGEIITHYLVGDGPTASVIVSVNNVILGDINFDGQINVFDVIRIVNFVLGNQQPTNDEFLAADFNGDEIITILDVIGVVNLVFLSYN